MDLKDKNEIGYCLENRNFLINVDGLPTIQINDMVENEEGLKGWVSSLSENFVEVLMIDEGVIKPGQIFKKLPYRMSLPVGDFLLGRTINPVGIPIDGKGLLSKTKNTQILDLDQKAPGVEAREFISKQFETGITIIDSLIPLGKGQRQLVMGDAHSGKTAFLIDLIVNQRDKDIICIYASIGKPLISVRSLTDILKANKALSHTIIVASTSADPPPLIFLTPKTAFSLAEFFQKRGLDVLVILDDMGIHAKVHREISLLGGSSPGKESYPGDIFYQQAKLLERAGNFKKEYGGGSITALPVAESSLTDFITLIPTNLMAMTDGHLLFRSTLHNLGQNPAIDIQLSVSRVGRQTQNRLISLVAGRIRQILSQAQELETVSRFSSELPSQNQLILKQKLFIEDALKQDSLTSLPLNSQVILLTLILTSFILNKDNNFYEKNKMVITKAFSQDPTLLQFLQSLPSFNSDTQLIQSLERIIPILNQTFSKN